VVRYRVVVTGRVQGVWYRQSCRRRAAGAGVAGWVRNNPDGTVEAVLEGEAAAVEQVLAWMRVGPPHAAVGDVEVRAETPVGERSFAVR
jgi:acylphosphatase